MRLKNYLNELNLNPKDLEWIVDNIKSDCKPFLKETRQCKRPMYRGHKKIYNPLKKHQTRQDRQPMHSHPLVHDFLDLAFKEVHNWKPRSEGLFVLGSPALYYGTPHYIFPIGNFKYLWSEKIRDLWEELPKKIFNKPTANPAGIIKRQLGDLKVKGDLTKTDVYKPTVNFIKKHYKTNQLCKALGLEQWEIMIKTKQFYAIDIHSLSELMQGTSGGLDFSTKVYKDFADMIY